MIWRDDDIGAEQVTNAGRLVAGTNVDDLRAVDDVFQRYGVPHTIAIIARDFDQRQDLIDLIVERRMVAQLHCWTHDDLTLDARARDDLALGVEMLERTVGKPTVLYPPWNRSSPVVVEAARELGLTVSTRKISLPQFIRAGGDVSERVVNFHYWHIPDVVLLDQALRLIQ